MPEIVEFYRGPCSNIIVTTTQASKRMTIPLTKRTIETCDLQSTAHKNSQRRYFVGFSFSSFLTLPITIYTNVLLPPPLFLFKIYFSHILYPNYIFFQPLLTSSSIQIHFLVPLIQKQAGL